MLYPKSLDIERSAAKQLNRTLCRFRQMVSHSLSGSVREELQCDRDPTMTNAKVNARAVIQIQNRILFSEYEEGRYVYIPGGGVEAGEVPTDALHRELMEESGCRVVIERYIGSVYYNPQKWDHILGPTPRLELMFKCSLRNVESAIANHIWLLQTEFLARKVAPFMIQFLELYLSGIPTVHFIE